VITLVTLHTAGRPAIGVSLAMLRMRLAAALLVVCPSFALAQTIDGTLPSPLPLFPPDNWWNLDISGAPVDPGSDGFIAFINNGGTRHLHPDFGGEEFPGSTQVYGMPYAVVDGTQPKLLVDFVLYGSESDGVGVPFYPIPAQAITQPHWVEGGDPGNVDLRDSEDRHLLIVDRDNKYLYELYNVYYNTATAQWEAGSGAFWDMKTNNRRPLGWTSADAAGLAIFPGLVRYDEAYDPTVTSIGHAFRVTVRSTNGYVYPASHSAGSTTGALPMGARLRLKATKDISGFTPEVQKIFQAMKTYGLIVADNGSDMYITGTFDTRWDNGVLNPAFGALSASDFEVVQLGWNPPVAPALSVDAYPGGASNENGVLEPGETAVVAPSWQSPQGGVPLSGSVIAFWGPPGANYSIVDGSAAYGSPAADTPSECWAASADCFRLSVSAPASRPAAHWDAWAQEIVNGEASKTWALHVGGSFADAPAAHPFYSWIETVLHNGVTSGCGDATYCPDAPVTRAQMAVFLLKSKMSGGYAPPPASGTVFADVPPGAFGGAWIEDLAASGVTSGCGGSLYCPDAPVTRAQMAVFLLKARHGSAYAPPPASGVFADVPASDNFAPWIEELAAEGVTAGCGGGSYCPNAPNTRGQMAVFLSKMFQLRLYEP